MDRVGWTGRAAVLTVLMVLVASCNGPSAPTPTPEIVATSSATVEAPTPTARPTETPTRTPTPAPSTSPTELPASASPTPGLSANRTILQLLAVLPIAAEQRAGYDDSLFPRWSDADGDGCNTRREVLIEESSTSVSVSAECDLAGGTWFSVYDGLTTTDTAEISIDHVVALAEAWDSGASAWSPDVRERFANDIAVPWTLIAVSPSSNSDKSDLDPADWMPPRAAARCDYLGDWVATKVRWSLSVDQREHDAIASLAAGCPNTTRPVAVATGVGSGLFGTPAPTATPAGGAGCEPAYPTVCIPPPPPDLDCSDISFRRFTVLAPDPHRFDGDGDGVGCEG